MRTGSQGALPSFSGLRLSLELWGPRNSAPPGPPEHSSGFMHVVSTGRYKEEVSSPPHSSSSSSSSSTAAVSSCSSTARRLCPAQGGFLCFCIPSGSVCEGISEPQTPGFTAHQMSLPQCNHLNYLSLCFFGYQTERRHLRESLTFVGLS